MSALDVGPLTAASVPDIARLAAGHVAAFRREVPLIPERWEEPSSFENALSALLDDGNGLIARSSREAVGWLAGSRWERAGAKHFYSPEWANVCVGAAARNIRETIYTTMAARLVADGVRSHFVSVLPSDRVALETLQWLGFGIDTVDAMRSLEHLPGGPRVPVARAGPADAEDVLTLEKGLREHLASSPLFFPIPTPPSAADVERTLGDDALVTLLARDDAGPLAYIRIGPASDDSSTIIRDESTASISRAFTRPDRRRRGVATTLLNAALEWARSSGYQRCAVDFESANLLASRFWLRHFTIVGLTLRRRM
jgi:GNAT superfamily N-acetyltransferase